MQRVGQVSDVRDLLHTCQISYKLGGSLLYNRFIYFFGVYT